MNKIKWINFLHIYQPPWQDEGTIKQVSSESYEYLIWLFKKYPKFKCTLNITGSLVDQLEKFRPDLLIELKKLVNKNQIELTGSAKYHAFLPMLPKKEIIRQIKLNQDTLKKYFNLKKIKGFYLPEMGFNLEVVKIVKKMGFKWIILDPISYIGKNETDILYKLRNININVVFRNRKISKQYPPETIYKKLKTDFKNQIILSAHDGETYGHFHEDWQGCIEKVIKDDRIIIQTISKYIKSLKKQKSINLRNSTWETKEYEIKNKKPYIFWNDPKNKIHQNLWKLLYYSIKLLNKYKKDSSWKWARIHLDQGLSSCTFWWSTGKKPATFSSLTWSPDMIDNGAEELIRSIRALKNASINEKIKAEKIYLEIKKDIWITHWKKFNKKL